MMKNKIKFINIFKIFNLFWFVVVRCIYVEDSKSKKRFKKSEKARKKKEMKNDESWNFR